MRNRLISTAVIALCVCLCACGIQEEVIPEEPAEQGDIIAEGSGNDAPDGGTQAAEPEDIADPGESGQTDENALSPDSLPVLETGTLSECITLCQLDGLKVSITLEEDPDAEDALIYARLLKDAKPLLDPESGIRPGDVVSIDMYAVEDGDKDLTRLGVSVPVGAGTQPEEIEDTLIGMRRDEEKKVTVTYPEEYLFMDLDGRTVRYRICVDSIARPDEPSEVETGKALTYLEEEIERVNRERLTEAARALVAEQNGGNLNEDDENPIQIVITAVPDEKKGEKLVALYVDLPVSPEDICQKARDLDLLPHLWIPAPANFREIDQLPVLGTGKLDIKGIKRKAMELYGVDREI